MHIELSDNVIASAMQLALKAGFSDIGEYLAHLIAREQADRHYHAFAEQKLLDGLASPASPMTQDDWNALKNRIPENKDH